MRKRRIGGEGKEDADLVRDVDLVAWAVMMTRRMVRMLTKMTWCRARIWLLGAASRRELI